MGSLGHAKGCHRGDKGWQSFSRRRRFRCCHRLTMNCVTVEVAVVLRLNRDSHPTLLPPSIFLILLLLSRPQYRTIPLPSLLSYPPSISALQHFTPWCPMPGSALLCFLLWLLPCSTACETLREARNSSSHIKAWDYIKNGSVCNVQCNQLREGSYNSSGRTGGTAKALGSLLWLLKTPHQALLLPFRGLLSSHATCQQLLSPVKDPGTENTTGAISFSVLLLTAFCSSF